MAITYTNVRRISSPRSDPHAPFPLIWSPRHAGTYLLVAGIEGAS